MKFKRPKLPKCPDLTDARGNMQDIAKAIRTARHDYLTKCFAASEQLSGKALATFIGKVADQCKRNGLYSPNTFVGEIAWSVARWFSLYEAGWGYWGRSKWWAHRGLTDELIREMRKRCGRGHRRNELAAG